MKKIFVVVLCLLMLVGVVSCQDSTTQTTTTSEDTTADTEATTQRSGDEEITLELVRLGSEEAFKPIFDPIVEAFEAEHQNIKVDFSVLGWSEAVTKLRLLAGSGDLPDVTFINLINGYALAHDGYLVDLTSRFKADAELVADFPESLIEAAQFEGGLYWLPSAVGAFSMWYRKDLFEQAGLDPSSPPETWEQLREYAIKITEETGVYGFGFGAKSSSEETADFVYSLYASYTGNNFFDVDSRTVTINEGNNRELFKQGLEMIYDIVNNSGAVPPNPGETNLREYALPLYNSECAMIIDGVWQVRTFREELDKGEDSNIAAALFPAGPAGSNPIVGVDGWSIADNTEHPEEAWTLLKFLVSPESQTRHSSEYGLMPMLDSMQGREEFSDPHWGELVKQLDTVVPRPQDYQIAVISQVVSDAFASYILGTTDVEETMDNMISGVAIELE